MDIHALTGSLRESHVEYAENGSLSFQKYFPPVPSTKGIPKITPFPTNGENLYPNSASIEESHINGNVKRQGPISLHTSLPSVGEMLNDLLGKCEGVMENQKPLLSFQEKETSISKTQPPTKNSHLQTFNLDDLATVLTNKSQKIPTNSPFKIMESISKKNMESIPEKNLMDPFSLVITEAGFTEKHIPNGRFPIILEEYTEKQIPIGQFEIDFTQTPKDPGPDNFSISNNENSILETFCLKRKFSERFLGMMNEPSLFNFEDPHCKRLKLPQLKKDQAFCDTTKKTTLSLENFGKTSPKGLLSTNFAPEPSKIERDIISDINNNYREPYGKNRKKNRVKMPEKKSWTKMTPELFSNILFWERAQGRAVKRTEIESKWNVNRTTYHRWKRNYGIEDTGKSFYLEYWGTPNFK